MANFEGYERRIGKIEKVLAEYGFKDLDEVKAYTQQKGVDAESIVRGIQPIAFENACWAYTLGAAIALKKGCTKAATRRRQSASVFRRSVFPARLQIREA